MQHWVVSKALPVTAPQGDTLLGLLTVHTTLYWAGPHTRCCPAARSWVWLTGLSTLVAHFPTHQAAETAARDFAGASWRTGGITIDHVHLTVPEDISDDGEGTPRDETRPAH